MIIDFKNAKEDRIIKRIEEIKLAKHTYNIKDENLDNELKNLIEELQQNSGRLGKTPHTQPSNPSAHVSSINQNDLIASITEAENSGLKVSNITFVEKDTAISPKIFIYYKNNNGKKYRIRNTRFYSSWLNTLFEVLRLYETMGK